MSFLAAALLAATPALDLEHPLGTYHPAWSYESGATAKVRELLDIKESDYRGRPLLHPKGLEALPRVAPADLRELVAALMSYHLRAAGVSVTEGVSVETPQDGAAENDSVSTETASSPTGIDGDDPQKEASYATATPATAAVS